MFCYKEKYEPGKYKKSITYKDKKIYQEQYKREEDGLRKSEE